MNLRSYRSYENAHFPRFLIWVFLVSTLAAPQNSGFNWSYLRDFTQSPTEHIINEAGPFEVRSVKGVISSKSGTRQPLPQVLIEIEGPGDKKQIRRAETDDRGRFAIQGVASGTYEFKTTLNGFQSVVGTVVVSKKAGLNTVFYLRVPHRLMTATLRGRLKDSAIFPTPHYNQRRRYG